MVILLGSCLRSDNGLDGCGEITALLVMTRFMVRSLLSHCEIN